MATQAALRVPQAMVDAILAQARAEYPNEACGVIIGRNGIAERLKPMFNAAASPTFYEFDPKDLLSLYREVDDNDEEIVVIYHSHTETEAYPSRTEIAPATEFRSYRIIDGAVTEEQVEIIP
jgi:proteasome lid subunit RPN8/RPN11